MTCLEFFDASGGVHNLCLSRVERMALVADIDFEFILSRSDGGLVAAYAMYFGSRVVFGVNLFFHMFCIDVARPRRAMPSIAVLSSIE